MLRRKYDTVDALGETETTVLPLACGSTDRLALHNSTWPTVTAIAKRFSLAVNVTVQLRSAVHR